MDLKGPVHLYNAEGAQVTCYKEDEVLKFKAKGFGPGYRRSSFPVHVYSAEGIFKSVANEVELEKALADGYSEEYVAKKAPKQQEAAPADDSITRLLLAELQDLKARLKDLEQGSDPLLQPVKTKKAKD